MDPFILFYTWAAMTAAALVMALYIDHRTRRRVRSGALPAGVFLIGWGSWINPFILFSPTFLSIQNGIARWLIWPLRVIVGFHIAVVAVLVAGLAYLFWQGGQA